MNLKALFSMIGIQGIGAILSFGSVLALTSVLGVESYGKYAWIVSIGSIGSLLFQRGLSTTIVKRFSPISFSLIESPSPLFNTLLFYLVVSAVALVAAAFLTGISDSQGSGDIILSLPIAVAMASFTISDAILRSAQRGDLALIAGQILRTAVFLLGILGLSYVGHTEVVLYLALYAVTFLVAAAAFLLPMLVQALSNWRGGGQVKSNWAHFQASMSRSIGNHLPVFITGFFVPPETLAYLAIAIRLTGPTRFGLKAARAYFGARMNGAIKDKDHASVLKDYGNASRFSAGIAFTLAIVVTAVVFALTNWQQGPFSAYNPNLLVKITAVTALSHLAFAFFGPTQLLAVLLGCDRFVGNLNTVFLLLFAGGLLLAGMSQQILASGFVMVIYSLGLSGSFAWKVSKSLKS